MPKTRVVLYREEDGSCPFLEWFNDLPAKVQDKCYLRLERLREMGHQLRRPEADFLRDGIYELRVSLGGVHHRILYFFHGTIAAVVSHGLVKERVVPPKEIDHAVGYASMARIGEKFKKNEPLGILYCRTRKQADAIGEKLQNAYKIAVEMPKRPKLIRTMV